MKSKKLVARYAALMLILACAGSCSAQAGIPFVEALREANVTVTDMQDGQRQSLILGNGDFYGIVWVRDGELFMRVTKNDIWDARVDTSEDGDLPRVDIVNNKVTGPKGAPPSYLKPYPQPRCAAALRLGPAAAFSRATLDIEVARAFIQSKTPTVLRVLHDHNVLLVHSQHPLTIEEIKAKTLPPAQLGKSDGVSWLHMKMPGDIDYKGMDYALAVATRGNLKAVSLVTSFDIQGGDVLEHAIALAREALAEPEAKLVLEHEESWQRYWSRSGLHLEDKVLRWWYRMLYFAHTVCKPGAAPVGLMPPLATDATPWHADYHFNYNAWQAFWPLPAANQAELADPWIAYVHSMIPRLQFLAQETYDCEGMFCTISSFLHEPDPAQCQSKNKRVYG